MLANNMGNLGQIGRPVICKTQVFDSHRYLAYVGWCCVEDLVKLLKRLASELENCFEGLLLGSFWFWVCLRGIL